MYILWDKPLVLERERIWLTTYNRVDHIFNRGQPAYYSKRFYTLKMLSNTLTQKADANSELKCKRTHSSNISVGYNTLRKLRKFYGNYYPDIVPRDFAKRLRWQKHWSQQNAPHWPKTCNCVQLQSLGPYRSVMYNWALGGICLPCVIFCPRLLLQCTDRGHCNYAHVLLTKYAYVSSYRKQLFEKKWKTRDVVMAWKRHVTCLWAVTGWLPSQKGQQCGLWMISL